MKFTGKNALRTEQAYHLAWLGRQSTGGGGGGGLAIVISVTTSQAIPASQTGATYDNYGAPGDVVLTLPPWSAGLFYSFAVVAPFVLTVAANGADSIAAEGALFGSLGNSMEYAFMSLLATNRPGVWVARTLTGGWGG